MLKNCITASSASLSIAFRMVSLRTFFAQPGLYPPFPKLADDPTNMGHRKAGFQSSVPYTVIFFRYFFQRMIIFPGKVFGIPGHSWRDFLLDSCWFRSDSFLISKRNREEIKKKSTIKLAQNGVCGINGASSGVSPGGKRFCRVRYRTLKFHFCATA